MICRECDAEALRGGNYCDECAKKANCPKCGKELVGVDRNQVFIVQPCPECEGRERKEYLSRLRELWAGVSRPTEDERYRFPVPPARFRVAVPAGIPSDLLKRMVQVVVDGEMGMLRGPVGVGKTHAMWALVFAVVSKNHRKNIRFVGWSDLCICASQCDAYGEYGAEMRMRLSGLASCDLLLVDEFATTTPRDNQFHQIQSVLNRRYEAKLPTLVATTMDDAGLAESMGQAIVSRLCGGYVIELNGKDRRIG